MLRLVVLASLLMTLALAGIADASPGCRICIEAARAEKADGGTALRFTARAIDGATFPETGTAVVMQVDGNRSKCITVSLRKVGQDGAVATYSGLFTAFYGNLSYSGRVDLGGDIHEFVVRTDGSATVHPIVAGATTQAAPAAEPAIVLYVTGPSRPPDLVPASASQAEAATGGADRGALVSAATQPMLVLGLAAVLITLIGAFVDRRRALERTIAA